MIQKEEPHALSPRLGKQLFLPTALWVPGKAELSTMWTEMAVLPVFGVKVMATWLCLLSYEL